MMHAYNKPEAEIPQTSTDTLADDLHSEVAFANLRDTVQLQQLQLDVLRRSSEQLMRDVSRLSDNLREMATRVSELTGVLTSEAFAAAIGGAK